MDFNLAVMLRESARRAPAKTAVILGDATLSYAQLDELSDRVAASLTAAGLAPGDRVGLQLPNIPQFVIAYFGILKAGGVVVPMNVLLKAPEIAFQLENSGARTLITYGGFVDEAAKAAEAAAVTSLYVVGAGRARRRAGDPGRAPVRGAAGRRRAGPAAGRARPGRPGGDHLHLRHHRNPEGRRAVAHRAVHERRHPRPAVRVRRGRRRDRGAAALPRVRAVVDHEHLRPARRDHDPRPPVRSRGGPAAHAAGPGDRVHGRPDHVHRAAAGDRRGRRLRPGVAAGRGLRRRADPGRGHRRVREPLRRRRSWRATGCPSRRRPRPSTSASPSARSTASASRSGGPACRSGTTSPARCRPAPITWARSCSAA